MITSDEGARLVSSFEGYHRALPDGSCTAYQTKLKGGLDIPTIGFGCTEGVTMGMVWTREQAEQRFRKELVKHEAAVLRLVTVEINQNEFDALVSLSYNIGTGIGSKTKGLANSSVLAKLNRDDRAGAARAFNLYNKAQGHVEKGLVSRRAREAALFLKPVEKPAEPFMPQAVEASKEPMGAVKSAVLTGAATTGTGIALNMAASPAVIPPPPAAVTDTLSNADMWTTLAQSVAGLATLAGQRPLLAASVVVVIIGFIFGPSLTKYMPAISWGKTA